MFVLFGSSDSFPVFLSVSCRFVYTLKSWWKSGRRVGRPSNTPKWFADAKRKVTSKSPSDRIVFFTFHIQQFL